jgi:type VI protein secretion system component VasF
MDSIASAAVIACGIAAVVLLLWSIWRAFMQPWLQDVLAELRDDMRDGGR